ncbi:SDR family oxidoreductase [Arthrobacter crusticola]|nr:SDR family NAD(P)-dependent oxidoreductase [Arthrobacter crusticola]
MELQGLKVLLTGGGSGVGLELARQLVAAGSDVLITGRDEGRLDAAATQIPGLRTLAADLARAEDLPRMVDAALSQLGGLSLLVNNAGIQLNYHLATRPVAQVLADVDLELRTDLIAPIQLTALSLPHLMREPHAAVVNIGSGLAVSPKRSAAVYGAAKAGLRTFTKALRYQLAVDAPGISAVDVVLPLVDTPMTAGRGAGKISVEQAAHEILAGLRADRSEIHVGKARAFLLLHRLAPRRADALLADG